MTAALASNVVPMTEPTFDDFWACVQPERRRGRLHCRIVFGRIVSEQGFLTGVEIAPGQWEPVLLKATAAEIIAGWRRYSAQFLKPDARWCPVDKQRMVDGGRYCKLPFNWLREAGWEE
jgi:hypothetical protein